MAVIDIVREFERSTALSNELDIIMKELEFHHSLHEEEENIELASALKRVIEYYGGSVDNG